MARQGARRPDFGTAAEPAGFGIPPAGERPLPRAEGLLEAALEWRLASAPLADEVGALMSAAAGLDPRRALHGLRLVGRLRGMLDGIEARLLADAGEQVHREVAVREGDGREGHGYPLSSNSVDLNESSFVQEAALALRVTKKLAHQKVGTAQGLRYVHPDALERLSRGDMTGRAAASLVRQTHGLPLAAARAIEEEVLPAAETCSDISFARRTKRLRERQHPESLADRRGRAAEDRSLTWWPEDDGMAKLQLYLPAEDVMAMVNTVDAHAAALRGPQETRRLPQLRADILRDALLDGWPGKPAKDSLARPLVTIPAVVLAQDAEHGVAELEGYGPIPMDAAVKLAARAPSLRRVLTDPWTGAVLDVGRKSYRASKVLRSFVRIRDQRCRCPGCNALPNDSELDHIDDWAKGGGTSSENTHFLCQQHQVFKHVLGWRVVHRPDGTAEWNTPNGTTVVDLPEITQPPAPEWLLEPADADPDPPRGADGRGQNLTPGQAWDDIALDPPTRRALCLPPEPRGTGATPAPSPGPDPGPEPETEPEPGYGEWSEHETHGPGAEPEPGYGEWSEHDTRQQLGRLRRLSRPRPPDPWGRLRGRGGSYG